MRHPPGLIVVEMIRGRIGPYGTLPTDSGEWPLFYTHQPDSPDDSLCLYDTAGEVQGRLASGEHQEQYGVQIRIRSASHADGWRKADEMRAMLEVIHRETVLVEDCTYMVDVMTQQSPILSLGQETDTAKRRFLFTINYLVWISQTD